MADSALSGGAAAVTAGDVGDVGDVGDAGAGAGAGVGGAASESSGGFDIGLTDGGDDVVYRRPPFKSPVPTSVWACSDPDLAWPRIRPHVIQKKVTTVDVEATPSPPDGQLRVVCISDTHGLHTRPDCVVVPDGDILVHAGDFTNTGHAKDVFGTLEWLESLPHKHKVLIAGNHDTSLHKEYYDRAWSKFHRVKQPTDELLDALRRSTRVHFLEDASVTLEGLKVYGSPWQPEFCDWAFNLNRGEPCREVWRRIPTDTDVLVTHGPPVGYGDRCQPGNNPAGCVDLLREVQLRVKPVLHVFGHIHEAYGATSDGVTTYVNASTCTLRYKPKQPPVVMDLPRPAM